MFRGWLAIFGFVAVACVSFAQTPPDSLGHDGTVRLTWQCATCVDDEAVGFKLYYGAASHSQASEPSDYSTPAPYDTVVTIPEGDAREYVLGDLLPGVYYFRLTAFDAAGNESIFSNEASGVVGLRPVNSVSCVYVAPPPIVEIVGTPLVIEWASGADPPGQNLTIPVDATAAYMFWSYYNSTAGVALASASLGGVSPQAAFELPASTPSLGFHAIGVTAWSPVQTGDSLLDVAWDISPTEGATTTVVFIKDGAPTGWRDLKGAQGLSTTQISATLNTSVSDLVLKYDVRFSGTASQPPDLSAGWESEQTQYWNKKSSRLSSFIPAAASVTCHSENERYSSFVCVSIPVR